MTKPKKKFTAKELRHDPFRDWYERQAEWVQQHREPIRRTLYILLTTLVFLIGGGLGYSLWRGTAERRLAQAYDIFTAEVSQEPPTNATGRVYKTETEKYQAALEAYSRVSDRWYYKYSDYGDIARYHKALCQLHLNAAEGRASLERLAHGDTVIARLARLALAEHFLAQGEGARAEALYRQLVQEPGQLPQPRLQLGLARALQMQGKKAEAVNLYLKVAKERTQDPERSEAISQLADLDPKALDQLPQEPPSAPRDALARYKKK